MGKIIRPIAQNVLCGALCVLLAAFSFVSTAHAAPKIECEVQPNSGSATDTFVLTVSVRGVDGDEIARPRFEPSEQFSITFRGAQTEVIIVNGKQNQIEGFLFAVVPVPTLTPGEYELPGGEVQIGRHTYQLPRSTLTIEKPEKVNAPTGAQKVVDFVQVISNNKPYAGEQLTYKTEAASTAELSRIEVSDTVYNGFWRESLGDSRRKVRDIGLTGTRVYTLQEALYPIRPGPLEIPARGLLTEREVRRPRKKQKSWSVFEDIWPLLDDPYETVRERYQAPEIKLDVQPLPPAGPGAPPYIPVGKLSLSAEIDRAEIEEGEGVSMRVEVSGDGYLRPLELEPERSRERLFKIYPEKPALDVAVEEDRVVMTKRFSMALVPQQRGSVELPRYSVMYFDPRAKKYETIFTPSFVVRVKPGSGSTDSEDTPVPPQPSNSAEQQTPDSAVPNAEEVLDPTGPYLFPTGTVRRYSVPSARESGFLLPALLLPLLTAMVFIVRGELNFSPLRRSKGRSTIEESLAALPADNRDLRAEEVSLSLQRYVSLRQFGAIRSLASGEIIEIVRENVRDAESRSSVDQLIRAVEEEGYSGAGSGVLAGVSRAKLEAILNRVDRMWANSQ